MTGDEILQLKHLLASAVEAAYAEPNLRINSDGSCREGNEQTIAFRVGVHLHELLKSTSYAHLNLDCEYNKHGDFPKERPDGGNIRPDLMIHSRGNNRHNILVVEFAGWWKRKDGVKKDKAKLKDLTAQNYDYKYHLGILVKIEKSKAEYEYFRNGVPENS